MDYYTVPYDFAFDLTEKNALICSSLIYKSFLKTQVKNGLNFELDELLGSSIMYPGDIVKKFDTEYNSPKAELQFLIFYDNDQNLRKAFKSNVRIFRETWRR